MAGFAGGQGGAQAALPPHVQRLAQSHSDHIGALVTEARQAEDAREQMMRACPRKHRPQLEKRFERDRAAEVQRISRLRDEQRQVLDATLKGKNPLHNGGVQHVDSREFELAKNLPPPKEEMLNHELIFYKEMFVKFEGKTDGQLAGDMRRRNHVVGQRSHDTKMASSRHDPRRHMRDRRDLLVEKRALMTRLHEVVSEQHRMASIDAALLPTPAALNDDRSSTMSGSTGRSTARSTASRSTTASGATFCDRSAPTKWKNTIPKTVHPLW